jgi:hypothetical protein
MQLLKQSLKQNLKPRLKPYLKSYLTRYLGIVLLVVFMGRESQLLAFIAAGPLTQEPVTVLIGAETLAQEPALLNHLQTTPLVITDQATVSYFPYLSHDLPPLITMDSVLQAFDGLYETAANNIARVCNYNLLTINRILINHTEASLTIASTALQRQALEKNLRWLRVWKALATAAPSTTTATSDRLIVAELQLINEAKQVTVSPIWGKTIDYRYWDLGVRGQVPEWAALLRVTTWLDLTSWDLQDDLQVRGLLLLHLELLQDRQLMALWQETKPLLRYLELLEGELSLTDTLPVADYVLGKRLLSSNEISLNHQKVFQRLVPRLTSRPTMKWQLLRRRHDLVATLRALNPGTVTGSLDNKTDLADIVAWLKRPAHNEMTIAGVDPSNTIAKTSSNTAKTTMDATVAWQNWLTSGPQTNAKFGYNSSYKSWIACLALLRSNTPWAISEDGKLAARLQALLKGHTAGANIISVTAPSQDSLGAHLYRENFHGYVEPNLPLLQQLVLAVESLHEHCLAGKIYDPEQLKFLEFLHTLIAIVEKQARSEALTELEIDLLENYGARLLAWCRVPVTNLTNDALRSSTAENAPASNNWQPNAQVIYMVVAHQEKLFICRGTVAFSPQ